MKPKTSQGNKPSSNEEPKAPWTLSLWVAYFFGPFWVHPQTCVMNVYYPPTVHNVILTQTPSYDLCTYPAAIGNNIPQLLYFSWELSSAAAHYCTQGYPPKGFPGGSAVKNSPANVGDAGDTGLITGLGRFPGGGNATLSCILAEKIPRTDEPSRLQSMGSQRARHDWACSHTHTHTHTHTQWFIILEDSAFLFFFHKIFFVGKIATTF